MDVSWGTSLTSSTGSDARRGQLGRGLSRIFGEASWGFMFSRIVELLVARDRRGVPTEDVGISGEHDRELLEE